MDPVSQGVLGAALPQALGRPEKLRPITALGWLAGMAPDLDVLIQSSTDPLLALEYHRHFTHALAFIPIGALVCAAALRRLVKNDLTFKETYLACLLGYVTHGPLDACTTYGTQLLWPFADTRFAWNTVSVVDPLLTLPALALVLAAAVKRRPRWGRFALAWVLGYLLLGVGQRERAESVGHQLAAERGHRPVRLEAKPGFGNLALWKIVYEADGRFHVDAVRLLAGAKVYPGTSAAKLDVERDLPWLRPGSQQARDLARFAWFSNRYLALDERRPNFVIDIRYSVVPNQITPLWGVLLDADAPPEQHVRYVTSRVDFASRLSELGRMALD